MHVLSYLLDRLRFKLLGICLQRFNSEEGVFTPSALSNVVEHVTGPIVISEGGLRSIFGISK